MFEVYPFSSGVPYLAGFWTDGCTSPPCFVKKKQHVLATEPKPLASVTWAPSWLFKCSISRRVCFFNGPPPPPPQTKMVGCIMLSLKNHPQKGTLTKDAHKDSPASEDKCVWFSFFAGAPKMAMGSFWLPFKTSQMGGSLKRMAHLQKLAVHFHVCWERVRYGKSWTTILVAPRVNDWILRRLSFKSGNHPQKRLDMNHRRVFVSTKGSLIKTQPIHHFEHRRRECPPVHTEGNQSSFEHGQSSSFGGRHT